VNASPDEPRPPAQPIDGTQPLVPETRSESTGTVPVASPVPASGSGSVPSGPSAYVPSVPSPLVPSQPPPSVMAKAKPKGRWPLVLAIVVGVISLVCVGGLGIAYHFYDKSTAPNRSAPDVVVDNYLRAMLVNQNDAEAAQYSCSEQSGLSSFKKFRDSFVSREKALGGAVAFAWGSLLIGDGNPSTEVKATIVADTSGGSGATGESSHNWTFTVVQSSGWRVCGATENP
jgi:hypothetical protein